MSRPVRWAGPAGMAGGTLWIIATVLHASRPVGCVADQCATRPMRESSAVEGVLTLSGLLLFTVTAIALVVLVRRAGRFGRIGRAGGLLGIVGIATLVLTGLVQAFLFDGDFTLMPYFVIPGVAALVIGLVLLATAVLRSRVLPRWASLSLLVGTVVLAGANEQTHAAWLAIPFALSWIVVGYALWSSRVGPVAESSPRSGALAER